MNKIGKRRVRPCPKGQVTVSEQTLSLSKPAHSGRSTCRIRGTSWQYQAIHEQDDCATKRDMPQWRACPEWDDDSSDVTCLRVKVTVHLQAR